MSRKALPIKMLKKGELDTLAENTAKVKVETADQPARQEGQPVTKAPDFKKYLNVYNFTCELPGTGEVISFKPLTVSNLKEIQTMDPGKSDKDDPIFLSNVFDRIFESVIESEVDIENMYLNDRFTFILEIRKKTSGESYDWTLKCPKCKSQSVQIVDFSKMPVREVPEDIEPIIELSDQLSVEVKYLTRKDEKEVHNYYLSKHPITVKPKKVNESENDEENNINIRQKQVELSALMVAKSIAKVISPDGEYMPSLEDSIYLVENIPQQLYAKIGGWQDENFFGPDMKINIKCPHCSFSASQEINSSDFFS